MNIQPPSLALQALNTALALKPSRMTGKQAAAQAEQHRLESAVEVQKSHTWLQSLHPGNRFRLMFGLPLLTEEPK